MLKTFFSLILMISLMPTMGFTAQMRTFSCNGAYDGAGADFPILSIHFEANYEEAKNETEIEMTGEDSKIVLTGNLDVKGSEEFLKVTVKLKDSNLVILNNNSQLGYSAQGNFNFVGISLENLGSLDIHGKIVWPKSASFQCQTYRN